MGKKRGNYLGLAKRFLLGDGIIVPVDEAEDADEESSSCAGSGDSFQWPNSSSSLSTLPSSSSEGRRGNSNGKPASFAFAKERWRSLMMEQVNKLLFLSRYVHERHMIPTQEG